MHSRLRSLIVSTALSATLLAPLTAHAQQNEAEAKVHYQKGVDLYNDGSYTTALAELEKAYALSPHYRVLYSLALVRAQLSDFVGALRGFQEYQAAAVDESPQRKAEVKDRIDALQQKVSSLTIKVNVEDAEVYIDDQLKGTSPFQQAVLVNPGNHRIYAKKGANRTEQKSITVGAGASTRIALEIEGLASSANPSPSAGSSDAPVTAKSDGSVGFVTIGAIATGVLAAGAITTGILTLGARSDLKDKQEKPSPGSDLDSASSKVSTLALVTDILGGAAIVMGAVTVIVAIKKKPESKPTPTAWLTAGPTSLGVAGRF